MDSLKVGDSMSFKGPKGRFELDQNEKRAIGRPMSLAAWKLAICL